MSALLRKALEAGDQVIAHTPGTKKPIFANKGADHPHYANYSAGDHIVAANVHANRAKELNIASSRAGGSMTLKRQAAQSTHFATTHRQAGMGQTTRIAASMAAKGQNMKATEFYKEALAKAKGGEGSRGGHISGHTAAGKPIYSSDSAKYSNARHWSNGHETMRQSNAKHFGDYSHDDHVDAAKLHHRRAMRAATKAKNSEGAESSKHRQQSEKHIGAYEHHKTALTDMTGRNFDLKP